MMKMVGIAGNTFPVKDGLKAMGGRWNPDQKMWMVPLSKLGAAEALVASVPVPVAKEKVEIGGLGGIMALFETAKGKGKKSPFIVLSVPGVAPGVRLSVAGVAAKVPGSLNVSTAEPFGSNTWFGRITKGGMFEPSRQETPAALIPALKAFACDPAGEASKHGKLTGFCCFCDTMITKAESKAVGYGPICAKKFGLPWGKPSVSETEIVMKEVA